MNKLEIPKIGLGTWGIGGKMEVNYSNDKEEIKAIKNALEIGYTHIDTAEMYGAGHCEELIGEAIKGFDRSKLIIATKVYATNLAYKDVLKSAQKSLDRLGIDYIDIYYIHAPNPEIPLKETMKAFDKLMEDGKIKNIAVSNFTVELFEEAQKFTKHKIIANQVEYSLSTRESGKYANNHSMGSETLKYCQENDVLLVAERPLERGTLLEKNEVMDRISEKYNKSYAEIALNWLISQDNIITIPKSISEERLKENFNASNWIMEKEDIEFLRREYPNQI